MVAALLLFVPDLDTVAKDCQGDTKSESQNSDQDVAQAAAGIEDTGSRSGLKIFSS